MNALDIFLSIAAGSAWFLLGYAMGGWRKTIQLHAELLEEVGRPLTKLPFYLRPRKKA